MGGDFRRATELLEEALTLSRESGDPWVISGILTHLGQTFLLQGDLERATAANEEAVAMLREQKHSAFLADALDNLGWVALLRGNPDQAKALYAESLRLRREVGEKLMIGNSLQALASAGAAQGEAERTAKLFGAVEMLDEMMGGSQATEDDTLHRPYLAAARSQLDEAAWQEAWAEGRAMTLDQAISYALEEEEASG
jgi:tetratricopeptide (TPR) repeat protein